MASSSAVGSQALNYAAASGIRLFMTADRPEKPQRRPIITARQPVEETRPALSDVGSTTAPAALIPSLTPPEDKTPPRVQARLKFAPRVRDMYWCDYPADAQLPEFWKRRPVVIIATSATISGHVTVVPCSSLDQTGNKWAFKLKTTMENISSWAVCDKPSTMAVSRLHPDKKGKFRVTQDEFTEILGLLYRWLPKLQAKQPPTEQAEEPATEQDAQPVSTLVTEAGSKETEDGSAAIGLDTKNAQDP